MNDVDPTPFVMRTLASYAEPGKYDCPHGRAVGFCPHGCDVSATVAHDFELLPESEA